MPILLLRKRKLRHSLGRPSRSDFVQLEVVGDINMDYVLKRLSNNDNEIEDVYKDGSEYIIKIRIWNGTVCYLKTIQCKSIMYNDELVNEFGDVIFDNGSYKFMTIDNDEVILEIIADEILEVDS